MKRRGLATGAFASDPGLRQSLRIVEPRMQGPPRPRSAKSWVRRGDCISGTTLRPGGVGIDKPPTRAFLRIWADTSCMPRTQEKEIEMPTYRVNAIAVGVLFILCSAAAILSIVPLGGPVGAPVDFAKLAANDNRVVLTALIEFVGAATGMGIAIGLYPVLRKFSPAGSWICRRQGRDSCPDGYRMGGSSRSYCPWLRSFTPASPRTSVSLR